MDRRRFLGNMFALAVLQGLKTVPLLGELASPVVPTMPGVGRTPFTIILQKGYFFHGDIIQVGDLDDKGLWYFREGMNGAPDQITELTGDPNNRKTIEVYYTQDELQRAKARKISSIIGEYGTSNASAVWRAPAKR